MLGFCHPLKPPLNNRTDNSPWREWERDLMESKLVWLLQRRSKAINHFYNNIKHASTRVLNEQPSPSSPSSLLNPSRFFSSVSGRSAASSTCVAGRNSVIYGFRALHHHHKVQSLPFSPIHPFWLIHWIWSMGKGGIRKGALLHQISPQWCERRRTQSKYIIFCTSFCKWVIWLSFHIKSLKPKGSNSPFW